MGHDAADVEAALGADVRMDYGAWDWITGMDDGCGEKYTPTCGTVSQAEMPTLLESYKAA